MAFVATRRALISGNSGSGEAIALTLTTGNTIRPLHSFGWTAGTFGGMPAGCALTLLDSAGGQFSIGGNMLRLELACGAAGTTYTIVVQATAPGYSTTIATFALTVTNSYTSGLVARFNALDTGLLWQDTGGSSPVTADGQTIKRIQDSVSGWVYTGANGPTYKTNIQNGRAVMRFSGSQSLSALTSAAINFFGSSWLNNGWSIILIYAQNSYSTGRDLLGWGSGSANYLIISTQTDGTQKFVMGSGGATTSANGSIPLSAGAFGIQSITSDGAPDTLHCGFQTNGVYGYVAPGTSNNPLAEVSSTYTSGAMAPTAATIGARAQGSPVLFNGDIADILIFNRLIGVNDMEYRQQLLGTEWGITTTYTTPTLSRSGFTMYWQDDFDSLNMVPQYAAAGTAAAPGTADSNPLGWTPAHIAPSGGNKNAFGSPGALSTETEYLQDPRNPAYAANGVPNLYTVNNSTLTIATQATPAALQLNTTFNVTATSASGNVVTTNANFGALGVAVGYPFITGSSGAFGGLSTSTTYYIASIINSGANSTCTLSTTPPYLSTTAVTLSTASGTLSTTVAPCAGKAYLGGYLISQGWNSRQFGMLEVRAKLARPQSGCYPAIWQMPENGTWYDEMDTHEEFGNHGAQQIASNAHSAPYPNVTTTNQAYSSSALNGMGDPSDTDFHIYNIIWSENGQFMYLDGRLTSSITKWQGMYSLTVTNPSSGLTDGTYNIYGDGGTSQAKATLTVSGGSVANCVITGIGGGFSAPPVWYTNSSMTIPLNTTLPGVVLSALVGTGDPNMRLTAYEPWYVILQSAITGVAGTFNPALGYYPAPQFDYVRVYKVARPNPPTLTPGYDPTFDAQVTANVSAIVSAYSAQGVTLSAGTQTALSTLIRGMMSWQLRFDTVPMSGMSLNWTGTSLSLWDSYDAFYLPALSAPNGTKATAKINLKSPGTGDLTEVGAGITFAAQTGLSLPGTGAVYLNSGLSAGQFNNQDNGFDIFLPATPSNSTKACLMGFNTQARWDAGSSDFQVYLGNASGQNTVSKWKTLSQQMNGYMQVSRGFQHAVNTFQNGVNFWSGYYSSNNTSTWTGSYRIGSYNGSTAGAAFSFLAAGQGRRKMQEECEVMNTLLRTFFSAVGITVNV